MANALPLAVMIILSVSMRLNERVPIDYCYCVLERLGKYLRYSADFVAFRKCPCEAGVFRASGRTTAAGFDEIGRFVTSRLFSSGQSEVDCAPVRYFGWSENGTRRRRACVKDDLPLFN